MKMKRLNFRLSVILLHGFAAAFLQPYDAGARIPPAEEGERQVFRAGAATANITPLLGGNIVGNWKQFPADHVHDELYARCLVLDDGDNRLAFVLVDNIGLKRELTDEARRLIAEHTGLPGSHVLIAATHTHSSVRASGTDQPFEDYEAFIINRISDAVRMAINNLEPARIGWGAGNVPQHVFVRRWKMKPGTRHPDPFGGEDRVVMNPGHQNPDLLEPAAKPDPEVSFISVQSAGGRPIALLANYSLHYVGGVPGSHISADYFGVFADTIRTLLNAEKLDPPFVAMMSNGTSGDVNANDYGSAAISYRPYARMKVVAGNVAREVMRSYTDVQYRDWVRLDAAMEELTLNVRKPDREMIERANWVLSRPDTVTPMHKHEEAYAGRILQLLEWPDQINVIVQAFRIGDLGVAAIPFETFAEIGLEIKAKSPFEPSFTIGLANGIYGYLPTPRQHKLGGYETWMGTNKVEIRASEKIVQKTLDLFSGMQEMESARQVIRTSE